MNLFSFGYVWVWTISLHTYAGHSSLRLGFRQGPERVLDVLHRRHEVSSPSHLHLDLKRRLGQFQPALFRLRSLKKCFWTDHDHRCDLECHRFPSKNQIVLPQDPLLNISVCFFFRLEGIWKVQASSWSSRDGFTLVDQFYIRTTTTRYKELTLLGDLPIVREEGD